MNVPINACTFHIYCTLINTMYNTTGVCRVYGKLLHCVFHKVPPQGGPFSPSRPAPLQYHGMEPTVYTCTLYVCTKSTVHIHYSVGCLLSIQVKECPNPKRTSSKEMRTCSTGIQHNDSSSVLPDKTRSSDSDLEKERTGSLLEGTYNEEESSRLFQEALMAWRSSQNKEIKEGMFYAAYKHRARACITFMDTAKNNYHCYNTCIYLFWI